MQDVYAGWVEALRELGQHVVEFNLDDRLTFYSHVLLEVGDGVAKRALSREQAFELAANGLYACLYKTRPDVLIIVSAFFVPAELMDLARSYGIRVVVLHTESPYEDVRQLQVAAHADLNLVNDPVNLEAFRELAPSVYMPHAYRPAVHCPGPADPTLAADLAFVGTGYPSRIRFLEAMDLSGLDVLLAGNWQALGEDSPLRPHVGHDISECLDNVLAARVYRSASVGLNLYRREALAPDLVEGWAMGPREVEMAACGMFYLREPRGENDAVLGMLPAVSSPEEASEQLRYWLARPGARSRLAAQAREAIADRTFINHGAALLRLLNRQPATV